MVLDQGNQRKQDLRLRPPRHPLDRRAVAWWRTQLLLTVAAPVAVLGLLGALIAPARFWLLLPAVVIAVPGLLVGVLLPLWWYRVHRWEVTDNAVYVRTGFFWMEGRIAPMSRLQTVDTMRGPVQRIFGLTTVTVTTASARGALKVKGLDHATATELAERLALVTQATPGDAT
ncbi:PH domain-containing protein [Streptomyces sp. Je 1-369]|uniref:PH domain-containing protein n=1 Tax=Streptomyces sp. Je 1-369 TaxID=2966192 RepID=UPI002286A508|nr:PH domain-containing protein [Streptomyces sp. Je 1-369]WAL95418.1 PH domain-containing protein [Streptomyces sp. Je 1-369]